MEKVTGFYRAITFMALSEFKQEARMIVFFFCFGKLARMIFLM